MTDRWGQYKIPQVQGKIRWVWEQAGGREIAQQPRARWNRGGPDEPMPDVPMALVLP